MKQTITLIILFIGLNFYAQTTFKKGSITNLNNEQKTVYIQVFNSDYPTEINYKETLASDKITTINTKLLKNVEVFGILKFVRKNVPVEILTEGMRAKQNNNKIEFNTIIKSYLLKVLVKSENLTLYAYLDKPTKNKYFFTENKGDMQLLKYKKILKNNKFLKVNKFRNQLFKNFKLPNIKIAKLKYNASSLKSYFTQYILYKNQKTTNYKTFSRDFQDAVNLNVSSGYGIFSQTILNDSKNFNTTSNNNLINIGLDLEYFFNNHIKSTSLVFEGKYFLKNKNDNNFTFRTISNSYESTIINDFSVFLINLKLRKYWQVKKNNYIIADIGAGINNYSGGTKYVRNDNGSVFVDVESKNKKPLHFSLGFGYNYNNFLLNLNYSYLNGEFDSLITSSTTNEFSYNQHLFNLSLSYIVF